MINVLDWKSADFGGCVGGGLVEGWKEKGCVYVCRYIICTHVCICMYVDEICPDGKMIFQILGSNKANHTGWEDLSRYSYYYYSCCTSFFPQLPPSFSKSPPGLWPSIVHRYICTPQISFENLPRTLIISSFFLSEAHASGYLGLQVCAAGTSCSSGMGQKSESVTDMVVCR